MKAQKIAKANIPPARHAAGEPLTIIFDGMNLAHTAYHSYKRLSYKGESVSMIFGVPTMIRSILSQNGWLVKEIIVAWDGVKNKKRMKWLPEYKSHREIERKKNPENRKKFLEQEKKVRKILHYMGIKQAHDKEIEGDDMVYHLVKKYSKLSRVVVVSGDKDMLQLCNRDVYVYNLRTKDIATPELIGAGNYGVNLNQLIDFFCLVGDTSDDIPGYRGIGEVRAAKFLAQFGSINNYLNNKRAEFSGLTDRDKLQQVYKRNKKMMDLKWFNERYYSDYDIKWFRDKSYPKFNEDKFLHFCAMHGLKTFMTSQFKDYFKKLNDE